MQQLATHSTALALTEQPKALVGIDDGYACTKIALADGRLLAVPSQARVGRSKITWMAQGKASVFEYKTEGNVYSVGDVDAESTRFDGYAVSGLNRVIVQHALQCADLEGTDVSIVSGLPVGAFYRGTGRRQQAAIEAKRDNLFKVVEPLSGAMSVNVIEHAVIPEALAAWYDFVIKETDNDAAIDQRQVHRPLAIVDIGGRTTDTVVIRNQGVIHSSSGSAPLGLLDAVRSFSDAIEERFDLSRLDKRLLARAFQRKSIRVFGRDHDVSAEVTAAKHELVERVHARVSRQLGSGAELDCVLLIGGGAVALRKYIADWFPNQQFVKQPAFANARGMLKYRRYVCADAVSEQ